MASSAEVHATLDHPVIDSDGHMAEHLPTLAPYLEQEGLSLEDPALRRLVPPYGGTDVPWHDQTPEQRTATRTPRGPWWSAPARQTIDLATALFPALLYERLDEIGIDFGVVYPSLGLVFLHAADERFRRGACRALNRCNAETFAPAGRPAHPGGRHPHAHARGGGGRVGLCRRSRSGSRPCCAPATSSARSRRCPTPTPRSPGTRSGSTSSASTRPTTTTRCGPGPRSSGCRSPSTPASSA